MTIAMPAAAHGTNPGSDVRPGGNDEADGAEHLQQPDALITGVEVLGPTTMPDAGEGSPDW